MIKYLGSKRLLVDVLGRLYRASGATTALDLFTGTTRVAQEFCRSGAFTTAVDIAAYSEVFARCYVVADASRVDPDEVDRALAVLSGLEGTDGYVTRTFARQARYFHPDNARRIDAIRRGIDELYRDAPLWPILLTSLVEAADRVDSTMGLQMAYLKNWASRAIRPLELRAPVLTPGTGRAIRADARSALPDIGHVGFAYLDPPYNQHRYFTNYHVWETLVRGDEPATYGVAHKRVDARDPATKSPFNSRRTIAAELGAVIRGLDADVVVVSFNAEGFVSLDDLVDLCAGRGNPVRVLAFDTRRYIGASLGVYNPSGERVGVPGATHTTEFLAISAPPERMDALMESVTGREPSPSGR